MVNCNYKVKIKDIQNKYTFKIFCAGYQYDDTEIWEEIAKLGDTILLTLDPSTYVLTATLKHGNTTLNTSQVDLPLEAMIVDAEYDEDTKSLIITLQNGNTRSISLVDIVSGLVNQDDFNLLKSQVEYYKKYSNALPRVTGTGTSILLNNVVEAPMSVILNPSELNQESTPTPTNPQTIHRITGNNVINIGVRNILDIRNGVAYRTSYNIINNELSLITTGTWARYEKTINVKIGQTYNFKCLYKNNTGRIKVNFFDGSTDIGGPSSSISASGTFTRTITATTDTLTVQLYSNFTDGTTGSVTYYDIQFVEGDIGDYIPYQTPTNFNINLEDLEYCKIGNYSDKFFKNTIDSEDYNSTLQLNKWYLKKNVGKISSYNGETIETTYISTTGGLDTGATIYYGLTTSTYTLLNDTLQEQLENIYNWVLSYNAQTNITQTNADLPFTINASAIYDLNKLVDRVATLETE